MVSSYIWAFRLIYKVFYVTFCWTLLKEFFPFNYTICLHYKVTLIVSYLNFNIKILKFWHFLKLKLACIHTCIWPFCEEKKTKPLETSTTQWVIPKSANWYWQVGMVWDTSSCYGDTIIILRAITFFSNICLKFILRTGRVRCFQENFVVYILTDSHLLLCYDLVSLKHWYMLDNIQVLWCE